MTTRPIDPSRSAIATNPGPLPSVTPRLPRHRRSALGTTLAETIASLAIASAILAITTPLLIAALHRAALRSAAVHVAYILRGAQVRADAMDRYCGVKFTLHDDEWWYAVFEDGNGNGVLTSEIATGVDTPTGPPARIFPSHSLMHLGFPAGAIDFDTQLSVPPGALPVNFNKSTLCSFGPGGEGTPGSIYITDGVMGAMVRSSGRSGRVRMMFYNDLSKLWHD